MPTLFECYKVRRDWGDKPQFALAVARSDFERGRLPQQRRKAAPLGHGDVIRVQGRTFVMAIAPDDAMGPPWEEHDGHGVVSEWTTRGKAPGERVLNQDGRSYRYYDVAESTRIAKRDAWGLGPDAMAELGRKLGRTPTRKQVIAAAVESDFERLRQWCNDVWHWCGVCLFDMPRDGVERNPEHVANALPFGILDHRALWGIESDSPDYHAEVARELIAEF
jgi:hypothetical protein